METEPIYLIENLEFQDGKATAVISLNPQHPIYEGHFPGNPVTPGVCQLQMLKEVVTKICQKSCILKESKNIKFLKILTPDKTGVTLSLDYTHTEQGLKVKAQLKSDESIYLKFTGNYLFLND